MPVADHIRNLNMLSSNFGAREFYRLEVLFEDESWELFEKRGEVMVRDPSIQSVAKKVVNILNREFKSHKANPETLSFGQEEE